MFIQITKMNADWPVPYNLRSYRQAEVGSILKIAYSTVYLDPKRTAKKVWIAETCNHSTKGIVTLLYLLPNFTEAVEITEDEYNSFFVEAIQKLLIENRLLLPTGTGHQFTTGSDPEMFVVDEQDVVIPAWKFLGPEDQPNRANNKLIPFWDGFQAEFNIDHGGCHAQRVDQIQSQLAELLNLARIKFPKARLTSRAVLDIPPEMMAAVTDQQAGLGCSPSKNLYKTKPIHVKNPRELPFRFAGFHIHFGCQHDSLLVERIRSMDQILGPISVSLLRGLDDPRRRTFYGRVGEYRTPKHGLEWRVLSATALCHPIITHLMFDIARLVQQLPADRYANLWQVKGGDERIQHIVNEYDVDDAQRLLNENKEMFTAIIASLYATSRGNGASVQLAKKVETLILKGATEFLDADAVEKNWRLNDRTWCAHSAKENASVGTMQLKGL